MQERSVIDRREILEREVDELEALPARVDVLELKLVQVWDEMRAECSATRERLGAEIGAGGEGVRVRCDSSYSAR